MKNSKITIPLVILVIALGAYFIYEEQKTPAEQVGDAVEDSADSLGDAAEDASDGVADAIENAGDQLQ